MMEVLGLKISAETVSDFHHQILVNVFIIPCSSLLIDLNHFLSLSPSTCLECHKPRESNSVYIGCSTLN